MILKLLKDKSVVEKLEHFANVANEMSSKLVVKDDITDDYNVNRNNLKVFLSLIGILHQHYSDEEDPMAGISIIENDMDELQNNLWKLQDESEAQDKFKVECEEKMYDAQKESDNQDELRVEYEEKMYDAQKDSDNQDEFRVEYEKKMYDAKKEMDKYEEKMYEVQKEVTNYEEKMFEAQKVRDNQEKLRVEYEEKMWDSQKERDTQSDQIVDNETKMYDAQKERDILNEKIYSGYEKLDVKLNKIKVWLDSLDPARKQWVVDNFLTDNIKKKIFELEKKYGG
jgi:chromosome segregation ATPase